MWAGVIEDLNFLIDGWRIPTGCCGILWFGADYGIGVVLEFDVFCSAWLDVV